MEVGKLEIVCVPLKMLTSFYLLTIILKFLEMFVKLTANGEETEKL